MTKILNIIIFLTVSVVVCSQTGETLFDDDVIHEIKLTSSNSSIYTDMYNSHNNYLYSSGANNYFEFEMEIDGTLITDPVGVRMKGETSFTQIGTDKKPFKVDINKYSSDQVYEGVKKFNLHNARADASMIRDKICYDLVRKMGVNSPRVSFAKLYLNDVYWGLYSVVEQVDKVYLKENFGNKKGNLYKSASGGSVSFQNMILKTNEEENDFTNLDEFIAKIEETENPLFEDTLRKYLNVDAYLTLLATNVLILDIDKYWQAGKNFYLYENTETGKMEWVPWDYNLAMNYLMGESSEERNYQEFVDNESFDDKVIVDKIMGNENLLNQYLNNLCQLKYYFNTSTLFDEIDEIKSLIEPSVLLDTKKPYSNEEFQGNINTTDYNSYPFTIPGVKQFISDRSEALESYFTTIEYTCVVEDVEDDNGEGTDDDSDDDSDDEEGLSSLVGMTVGVGNMLYPNPVKRGQEIRFTADNTDGMLVLYSLQGSVVFSGLVKGNSIQLPSELEDGLYLYQIEDTVGKLVIEE